MAKKSLIIAGSTGLIGNALLNQALSSSSDINMVISISRNTPNLTSTYDIQKIHTITESDLFDIQLPPIDTEESYGAICLGTTIKQAGSKEALKHIDFELVVSIAEKMKSVGVQKLAVVSSIGANASSLSHYLKCKGEMEQALKALNFDTLYIAQPGPLMGDRAHVRKDEILLQKVTRWFKPLFVGPLNNYYPIHGETVASALLYLLLKQESQKNTPSSVEVFRSSDLRTLA